MRWRHYKREILLMHEAAEKIGPFSSHVLTHMLSKLMTGHSCIDRYICI